MKPHRTINTYTGSVMKITKIYYTFQTENHQRISITKANLLTNSDRVIGHRKYQYLRNNVETHNPVHFAITGNTFSSHMAVSEFLCKHIEIVQSRSSAHCMTHV